MRLLRNGGNMNVADPDLDDAPSHGAETLRDLLLMRAVSTPDGMAYRFRDERGHTVHTLTYGALLVRASGVARRLADRGGERALLLLPPGLEYVTAFFGCALAGVVVVPLYPPRRNAAGDRVASVAADCDASLAISNATIVGRTRGQESMRARLDRLEWVLMDDLTVDNTGASADAAPAPGMCADALAVLQYTSGSEGEPKGVMLSHANLMTNLAAIHATARFGAGKAGVTWLPPYHDMGLIGGTLYPLYGGFPVDVLPPQAFLRSPLRWLQIMTETGAAGSAAPNFALELCVEAAAVSGIAGLDLSAWEACFVGAEPVRPDTLARFADTFAPCGFRYETFLPCYGLAEATLLVTGSPAAAPVTIADMDEAALRTGVVAAAQGVEGSVRLVGCGPAAAGHEVLIVDPERLTVCKSSEVGEVWVAGPSVARGYWNADARTAEVFGAVPQGGGPAPGYLRTGDLGFLRNGELFVTGRLRDLLIIRGRNYYPQDIEREAEGAHPALKANASACVLVDDRLILVHELRRTAARAADTDEVMRAVRRRIADRFELAVGGILLLKPGGLPRTSSGKVRRRATQEALTQGTLAVVSHWSPPAPAPAGLADGEPSERLAELLAWLRAYGRDRINSALIDERRSIPPHIVLDFGNRGLLGLEIPAQYGGPAFSVSESLRVVEQLAAIDTTLALFVGVNNALGVRPLLRYGSEAMKSQWLPQLASGRQLAAFAITEPGAGSNPQKLAATALRAGEGIWHLTGTKILSGNAGWAGLIHVFARDVDAEGRRLGFSAYALVQGTPGLRIGPEALTMGVRGMVQNSVHLSGATALARDVLGEPGRGLEVAQDAMVRGRLGIAAIGVGAMKRCAQLMVQYASGREVATGPLLQNEVTRLRLSDLTAAITASEALVDRLAGLLDAGIEVPHDAYSACKILVPELAWRAVDDLMQMLGGRGFLEPNVASRLMRDVRLLRIFEGPTEALAGYVGTRCLSGDRTLARFIGAGLGRHDSAERLDEAIARLAVEGRADDAHVTRHLVGELAALALLHATVEGSGRAPMAERERAARWVDARFDACLERAAHAQRALVPTADEIASSVHRYRAELGDCQQTAPGADHDPDPLLYPVVEGPDRPGATVDMAVIAAAPVLARTGSSMLAEERAIADWMATRLARLASMDVRGIDEETGFADLGVDSLTAVQLMAELEAELGVEVDASLIWSFPTLRSLSTEIARIMRERTGGVVTPAALPGHAPREPDVSAPAPTGVWAPSAEPSSRLEFSLFYFSRDTSTPGRDPYRLLIEGARFADEHGFAAVWMPERHFHTFGGLYPRPAVLAAALALQTRRIRLRAGSVVLPLHHPVDVAESWAVVDNLSRGRVDLAFVPGWNPDDFLLAPGNFQGRKALMSESLEQLERLWRGEAVTFPNGEGRDASVRVYPRPVQPELPVWITCTGSIEGFIEAGRAGRHVLTALLFQPIEELAVKIAAYRRARAEAGFDAESGRVALMLHTFVSDDDAAVDSAVREPLTQYLRSSVDLWRRATTKLEDLTASEQARMLRFAYERYRRTASLIGSLEYCREFAARVAAAGVSEIACLIDFGVEDEQTLQSLERLDALRRQFEGPSEHKAIRPWIVVERPRPTAAIRLFCIPYAGGEPGMFSKWSDALPPEIEVCALRVPQGFNRMEDLLDALVPALLPHLDRPFALHGHSVGALVAFELARRLREQGHEAVHLFVAAQHAPHLPFPYPALQTLDGAEAVQLLRSLAPEAAPGMEFDPERASRPQLDGLRDSIALQSTNFTWVPGAPLACPLAVFGATSEPVLTRDHLAAWQAHTTGTFELRMLEGPHVFTATQEAALIETIGVALGQRSSTLSSRAPQPAAS
jgi:natural product biosynthesis luciferase-like monooxygenase protein